MAQKHLQPLTEKDRSRLRDLIGNDVYVNQETSSKAIAAVKKEWARIVRQEANGRFVGEIRDYDATGEPFDSGDIRDTWTVCLVDPKTHEVVWSEHWVPFATVDEDEYENDGELADEVIAGRLSLAEAKRASQNYANVYLRSEFDGWIDAGRFDFREFLRGRAVLAE